MALTDEGTGTTMLVQPSGMGGMGGGLFGGDLSIIVLFFLFMMLGGWGNGFGGGFGGGDLYPWMNNSNQMADLERSFAAQTASTAAMTGLQSQLANCCCENRSSIADLKYTVATEACADRNAVTSALRDVLTATQAQTQTILDKMCAQEIDNLKAQNIALQNQINMQALAASQTAQTAQLVADNTAQTQYIVNRVAPYPIPAYTVANPTTPAA